MKNQPSVIKKPPLPKSSKKMVIKKLKKESDTMNQITDLKNFYKLELVDSHYTSNEKVVLVFKSNDNMIELHTIDTWYKLFIKN